MKKALPGEHGDSLNYDNLINFMITFGVGIAIGIVLFGFVL